MTNRLRETDEKLAYRLKNAADAVDMSVTKLRQARSNGDLTFIDINGNYWVDREELLRWLHSHPTAGRRAS